MPLNQAPSLEDSGRRNFLSAMLGIAVASKTENILAQPRGPIQRIQGNTLAKPPLLNTLSRRELFEIIDTGENILQKSMPSGTKDANIRYFAIIPNRHNAKPENIKVYSGYMQPMLDKTGKRTGRQVMIFDANKKRVFPEAESVKGKGLGARVRLNNDGYIILSIGVPVTSKNLPEEERSNMPYTLIAASPPNKAFQTPDMQTNGRLYLERTVKDVIQKNLKDEDAPSKLVKGKKLHEMTDYRLVMLFAIVEHMDIGSMEDAKNPQKLEEEYARVLTNYALNRNLAYRYVQSGAGARGMLQIMPKVFQGLSDLYPDVDIGDDLTECAMDPTKSIITNTLKLDDDLKALQMTTRAFSDEEYMAFRNGKENLYFPLALGITYNYGYKALKSMQALQALTKIALPEETRIYLEKLKYVWEKLTRQKLGGGNVLGHDRRPREYKKNPQKVFNQSEAGMRTVLKGSRKRLVFEKHRATQVAKRALDYQDTRDQLKAGRLVRVTTNSNYVVDKTIGNEGGAQGDERNLLACLTPVAKTNLGKVGSIFKKITGDIAVVTSLSRNADYVKALRKRNPRATSPSSHEYGTTFDMRKPNNPKHRAAIEAKLIELQKAGYIIVIRESVCYHIFSEKPIP